MRRRARPFGPDRGCLVIAPLKVYLPGVALCAGVTAVSKLIEKAETGAFGHVYLEALVIAILVGVAMRAWWTPGPLWAPGIGFSAKTCSRSRSCCSAPRSARDRLGAGAVPAVGIAIVVAIALARAATRSAARSACRSTWRS